MSEDNTAEVKPAKFPIAKENAKVDAEKTSTEAKVKAGVDAFVAKHLRNSAFSRDTLAWNHLQEGLPLLIELVTKEVEG